VVTPLGQADSPSAFTVLSGGLTITPGNASVLPTRTVQFTASGPAEWLVNGILNGAPETGRRWRRWGCRADAHCGIELSLSLK
jgi:hypothetical protein